MSVLRSEAAIFEPSSSLLSPSSAADDVESTAALNQPEPEEQQLQLPRRSKRHATSANETAAAPTNAASENVADAAAENATEELPDPVDLWPAGSIVDVLWGILHLL